MPQIFQEKFSRQAKFQKQTMKQDLQILPLCDYFNSLLNL